MLTWLVHAFLHRNQISSTSVKHSPMVDRTQKEIFRHIRVFHEQDHEIQALLGQIESLLRRENVEFLGENEKLEEQFEELEDRMKEYEEKASVCD